MLVKEAAVDVLTNRTTLCSDFCLVWIDPGDSSAEKNIWALWKHVVLNKKQWWPYFHQGLLYAGQ